MIWRQAKSAPKDGIRILVGFRDPLSKEWRAAVVRWKYGGWFAGHTRETYPDGRIEIGAPIACVGFTHWTPIIEPKK